MSGLKELKARVIDDLESLELGKPTWVKPVSGVYDVIIVGGGQSGLGAAFGLMRERVSNVLVIDECPEGQEGPWDTYARMITLRTPKELTSIDLGVPSLTFRSWWIAQHGKAAWEELDKIPRISWMEYLRWYRKVLDLPVQNSTKVLKLEPQRNGIHILQVEGPDGPATLKAKKVVLATGIQGGGEWHTPEFIKKAIPKSKYAHTSEAIDFDALKGKRIAVLGGGASAFDNAQYALNLGVKSAEVFVRRKELPKVNPIRFMENTGLVPRFAALDDTSKYAIMVAFFDKNQPPTNDTFTRAASYPGFRLHLGSPWLDVKDTPSGVIVTTPKGSFEFDFLIVSTGIVTDYKLRPEMADFADKIAKWEDVFSPPPDLQKQVADVHPYLGSGFELSARSDDDTDLLHGLFAFNYSALISLGLSASALTGLGPAIPRLANAVANQLFLDDQTDWMEDYMAFSEEEFVSEWKPHLVET